MKTSRSVLLCASLLSMPLLSGAAHASVEVIAELGKPDPAKESKATEGDAPAGGEKAGPKPPAKAPGGGGAGGPKPMNQEKALRITVRNIGSKAEAGTTVRYWVMGRDMTTMKSAVLDGGEAPVNLKPNGTELIVSDAVKSTFSTRGVFVQMAAGGAAGAKPAGGAAGGKSAAGSGTKIVGYGVQVIKEGKVIAESFTDPGFKKLVGSDGAKPGDAFKKGEGDGASQ